MINNNYAYNIILYEKDYRLCIVIYIISLVFYS